MPNELFNLPIPQGVSDEDQQLFDEMVKRQQSQESPLRQDMRSGLSGGVEGLLGALGMGEETQANQIGQLLGMGLPFGKMKLFRGARGMTPQPQRFAQEVDALINNGIASGKIPNSARKPLSHVTGSADAGIAVGNASLGGPTSMKVPRGMSIEPPDRPFGFPQENTLGVPTSMQVPRGPSVGPVPDPYADQGPVGDAQVMALIRRMLQGK